MKTLKSKEFKDSVEKTINKKTRANSTTSNDAIFNTTVSKNSHLGVRGEEGAKAHAAWEKEHPNLTAWGNVAGALPFAVAAVPLGAGIVAGGDALAATTAGQAVTAGLAPLYQAATGTTIAGAPALAWADAGLTSAFGAHGISQAVEDGGISPMTALEVAPLGRLVKPVYESTFNIINSAYNKLPWTYKIPENPNMAYRRMGPLERDWLMEGNELSTRSTNALTEAERDAAVAAEKAANPNRRFVLFKAGAEHGGRKQFAKGQPWGGTTVTHGEEQVLAIPGKDLPWVSGRHFRGPQGNGFGVGDISFEEAPFGSHIDLLTNEGYSGVNPSLLDGSVIYSPYKILGRNFGYKKLYPKITTPQITAENAASITPEQWTAAQDAAIARGDMAEAQRLRDLHFKVSAPNTAQREKMYNASGESSFNEFNGGKTGLNWFSESEKYAANHGIPRAFYINEPDIYFGNVPAWVKGTPANERYIEALKRFGYTDKQIAQKVKEINEAANSTTTTAKSIGLGDNNELVTKDNNTIKLADAVSYDDNGVRIPLGERDNFNINDIRYGLLPFLGLGAAGTLYRKQD